MVEQANAVESRTSYNIQGCLGFSDPPMVKIRREDYMHLRTKEGMEQKCKSASA